jgi:hypothetical protein
LEIGHLANNFNLESNMQYVNEPNDDCWMNNLGKQLRRCKVEEKQIVMAGICRE